MAPGASYRKSAWFKGDRISKYSGFYMMNIKQHVVLAFGLGTLRGEGGGCRVRNKKDRHLLNLQQTLLSFNKENAISEA